VAPPAALAGYSPAGAEIPCYSRQLVKLGWGNPMVFVQICRAVTIMCCCLAVFDLIDTMVKTNLSAIQQAAGAAIAVATVVIPYVFTRSVEGFPFPPDK